MSSKRNASARDDWQTPALVLDLVRQVGDIYLDPATSKANPTGAEFIRTAECDPDGLESSWTGITRGLTFVNPPYRPVWYRKIHREAERGAEIVALIMAKPGSAYFQDIAASSSAICFWRGRMLFDGVDGLPAPAPAAFESALLYFGTRRWRFNRAFGRHGWCV